MFKGKQYKQTWSKSQLFSAFWMDVYDCCKISKEIDYMTGMKDNIRPTFLPQSWKTTFRVNNLGNIGSDHASTHKFSVTGINNITTTMILANS